MKSFFGRTGNFACLGARKRESKGDLNNDRQDCLSHQNGHGQKGFTLLELIMILVVIAIVLPLALMPFTESVKGIGNPTLATNIAAEARSAMEIELAAVDAAFPATATYTKPTVTKTVLDVSYSTTISGQVGNMAAGTTTFTQAAGGNYVIVTVTTTATKGGSTAGTYTFNAIKAKNF
ncbi:MAG: type II secretion system protein [Nitrospinae bacterium]|nr:type II secretion system protein [Nitrospinota bacterium]